MAGVSQNPTVRPSHSQEHPHRLDANADSAGQLVCASSNPASILRLLIHVYTGTESGYAKAISDFSILDSGSGHTFENLAGFLAPEYPPSSNAASIPQDGFIAIYELCQQTSNGMWSQSVRYPRLCEDFRHSKLYGKPGTKRNLVFLRGYPSPEWVRCIGSKYNIDPEYFRRYLEFGPPVRAAIRTPSLSLRSSSPKLLTLNVTTIQLLDPNNCRDISSERRRNANNANMERYIIGLLRREAVTGDPVVRDFWTTDSASFLIEQRISIYLQEDGEQTNDWTCKHDLFRLNGCGLQLLV